MSVSSTYWRVPEGAELRWRHWDGEHLVYHCDSGNTHRLNEMAAATLEALAAESLGADSLAARVAERLGIEADPRFLADVERLLAEFHEWGLIERVDGPERHPPTGSG